MKRFLIALACASLISCGGGSGGGGGGGSNPPPTVVTISISPTSASVQVGATQQFTASLTGTTNTSVTWQVNSTAGGNSTVGTISATGLYTAPAAVPSPATVTVTVVSQADTTKSASATVTLTAQALPSTYSNSSLNGLYSYWMNGVDVNGPFLAVGSVQADGNGNFVNGLGDVNHLVGVRESVSVSGTYSVTTDGRGTATLTLGKPAISSVSLRFVVLSGDRVKFIASDSTAVASGEMMKRDTSAFSTAAVKGGYAFGFDGYDTNGNPTVVVGRFTADGAGNITAGVEDTVEEATLTQNLAFTGSYSVDSSGRGTASTTNAARTSSFVFYVVSSNTLFVMELDQIPPAVVGTARKQQATSFSNASVSGDYAFLLALPSVASTGETATAGRFTANGAGGISSGVLDENDEGTIGTNVPFSGSYSVSSNGRGTATASAPSISVTAAVVFYMVSSQEAFMMSTDPDYPQSGPLLAQQGGPFSTAAFSGGYGFRLVDSYDRAFLSGRLDLDGAGGITGTEDINNSLSLSPDVPFTGTYSVASNGRGTTTITNSTGTANLVVYAVSDSQVFFVEAEPTIVAAGIAEKQTAAAAIVSISVSPTSASVQTGATQQFAASVSGTSNTAVTWKVNGTTGGSSTVGTISTSGLYTAPAAVPSPATVTVTAVSQADTTKSASATVTITSGTPAAVTVAISPQSATVVTSATQQFTATVSGSTNTAVTWKVNGTTGGSSTVGTISTSGLYTAPAAVPSPATVTVTAVSQADTTKSASATVTIVTEVGNYSNSTLNGPYAFWISGEDNSGFFLAVGSLQADGNGNFTNGVEDLNHGTGVQENISVSGTYSVNSDGRGTATLTDVVQTLTLRFVILSTDHIKFVVFDSADGGVGEMRKQDTSAFRTVMINGNYSFGFDGYNLNAEPATTVGRFTADGVGNLTDGEEDSNEPGTKSYSTFYGSYSVASNGRGTASFTTTSGTSSFAFQVVSADTLFVMQLDFVPAVIGTARKQQAASFSNASLSGDYAFLMALNGVVPVGETATVGKFTAGGAGNISGGLMDQNNMGTISDSVAFTATYAITSSGKGSGTVTSALGSVDIAFYMVSPQEAFLMLKDFSAVQGGSLLAQQGGPFSNSSLSGEFGLKLLASYDRVFTNAQMSVDGAGNISGTEDYNIYGALTPDESFTGTYSISSEGRGTASILSGSTTSNLVFYVVSGSQVLAIEVDPTQVAAGTAEKQQ